MTAVLPAETKDKGLQVAHSTTCQARVETFEVAILLCNNQISGSWVHTKNGFIKELFWA